MIVVSRAKWGARHDDGFRNAPIPAEWWLHHSAGLMPDLTWLDADHDGVDDEEKRIMVQLEQTGETRFGGGISYTWLVPPSGRAYVGHSMNREGAHTAGRNSRARGICLIGNYSNHRPTRNQLDTVAEIMVTEWRAGRARTYLLNGGHRDLQPTECPGDHAFALIGEINRRATSIAQGDDMTPDEMKTKVLAANDWRFDGRNPVDMWRHTVARVDAIERKVDEVLKRLERS